MKRLALGICVVIALLAAAGAASEREAERIVAVGDVHGAYQPLVELLRAAALIDADAHWSGGKATFVQLGDLVDRGPDDRRVLDLMMSLESEAEQHGGRVVALLGNHEVMNLIGDWRYVSLAAIAQFGGQRERRAAFAPSGKYGSWLRKRPAVEKIGDTVFVHGGLIEAVSKRGLRETRNRVRSEIKRIDAARATAVRLQLLPSTASLDDLLALKLPDLARFPSWLIANSEGPLWFRGYENWNDAELAARLPLILAAVDAKRIVVGHSVQLPAAIRVRAGGRAILIDTGMLGEPFYPGGAPLALEVQGERLTVIALDGTRIALLVGPEPARAALPTPKSGDIPR